jgi:glyoxylase-like metal-dependent hydrolase (beta-lactamase superfamily II)
MIKIGNIEVTRIEEVMLVEQPTSFADFRPELIADIRDWLLPNHYDEKSNTFIISVHSWLLRTPDGIILIDTASGNAKTRPLSPRLNMLNTPYLDRLKAAGVAPEDVDTVIHTHLHVDHVGWNTYWDDDRWVPTFPKATTIMSAIAREAHDPKRGAAAKPLEANLQFSDSVQPILDAGTVRLVDGTETLFPGIELVQAHGHAPGHMMVRVRSGGREALFIGDVMHQPIQIAHPTWNSKYCEDPPLARETRARVLDYCADERCLTLPVHFNAPYCGYIERRGGGYTFVPSDETP